MDQQQIHELGLLFLMLPFYSDAVSVQSFLEEYKGFWITRRTHFSTDKLHLGFYFSSLCPRHPGNAL